MKSPSLCPCCGLSCYQGTFKLCRRYVYTHPDDGVEIWCQFCNTWFMWDEKNQIAKVRETAFPRGYKGNKGEIVDKPVEILATAGWNPETQQRGEEDLIWGD